MTLTRRLLIGTLIVSLPVAILPGAAAAEIIDGRPGQFSMSSMLIDAVTDDCLATYETPVGNIYIRGAGSTVHVTTGRGGARATCRFTDISIVNEANAEVGHTTACTLVTAAGTWSGGTGRVTSAANISDRSDGGNSMIRCRFDAELAPEPTDPGAADEAVGPIAGRGGSAPQERRVRAWTRRPLVVGDWRPLSERPAASQRAATEKAPKARAGSGQSMDRKAARWAGRGGRFEGDEKPGKGHRRP